MENNNETKREIIFESEYTPLDLTLEYYYDTLIINDKQISYKRSSFYNNKEIINWIRNDNTDSYINKFDAICDFLVQFQKKKRIIKEEKGTKFSISFINGNETYSFSFFGTFISNNLGELSDLLYRILPFNEPTMDVIYDNDNYYPSEYKLDIKEYKEENISKKTFMLNDTYQIYHNQVEIKKKINESIAKQKHILSLNNQNIISQNNKQTQLFFTDENLLTIVQKFNLCDKTLLFNIESLLDSDYRLSSLNIFSSYLPCFKSKLDQAKSIIKSVLYTPDIVLFDHYLSEPFSSLDVCSLLLKEVNQSVISSLKKDIKNCVILTRKEKHKNLIISINQNNFIESNPVFLADIYLSLLNQFDFEKIFFVIDKKHDNTYYNLFKLELNKKHTKYKTLKYYQKQKRR